MDEYSNYVEYTVVKKAEGSVFVKRALAMALYIIFPIAFLVVFIGILKLWPVGALAPVLLWMLVFFTWRYIAPEYEYVIKTGLFTFSEVYGKTSKEGNRKEKKILEVYIRDMSKIAPISQLADSKITPVKVYDGMSSKKSPDGYFADYKNAKGEDCRVLFDATNKTLKIMTFYNKEATVMSTTLRH